MISMRTATLIILTICTCALAVLMRDRVDEAMDDCSGPRITVDRLYTIDLDATFRDNVAAQIIYSTDECFTEKELSWAEDKLGAGAPSD